MRQSQAGCINGNSRQDDGFSFRNGEVFDGHLLETDWQQVHSCSSQVANHQRSQH